MTDLLDPFDPAALRLPQDFTETASVKKLLETIPVDKFNKQDFFRTHPDPAYRIDSVGLLELKDERERYLVTPTLYSMVFTATTISFFAYQTPIGRLVYTGRSTSTINKSRVYGGGPPYYKVGGIVTYDLDDIDAWLAAHKHTSTSGDQA